MITRRYHGLLCAATPPPVGRIRALNRVGELQGDVLRREIRLVVEHLSDTEDTLLNRSELERLIEEVLDETIGLGSKVTLRADDGEDETWVLVSPQEANTLDGTRETRRRWFNRNDLVCNLSGQTPS